MRHAQALVTVGDPSALGARLAAALGDAPAWAAEAASLSVGGGTCDAHAWPDGLRLDLTADDEATLVRVETAVAAALRGAASGEQLLLDWYRRPGA